MSVPWRYPTIYLASQSPRRRELLAQIGVEFEGLSVSVDETPLVGEQPRHYVERLAIAKSQAGWQALAASTEKKPVLGADTAVVMGDRIMGKPNDRDHALSMLRQLSGQTHRVLSAVCLTWHSHSLTAISETEVSFRGIGDQELERYWQSGEPLDKAGGYAIQGYGAVFVRHIAGSYSGVVGLPLLETSRLLDELEAL